ncbi:hypothetical protein F0358_17135 (plasmid) [Empedobacter brevis]|uniref:hypothetical protein n=1 Tax=Pseudomonadati TaxID=3379134 RepID=UPI00123D0064|nr:MULTISPECIES: hypothetical protein [Bacteria]MDM1544223.1 hypothetical protein [Empedobacter sp. 189-2]QES94476.1 hypothetical protein F0358_17135 [Empedobacter brevis]
MNYIDVKEAVKKTGKSERTIRRLFANSESVPYLQKKGNKVLIEVNYLFSIYEPLKDIKKPQRQKYDIAEIWQRQEDVNSLKTKLALFEQELKNKELLLQEKEGRIIDLQKTILLLEAPKKEPESNQPKQVQEKKKKWWQF